MCTIPKELAVALLHFELKGKRGPNEGQGMTPVCEFIKGTYRSYHLHQIIGMTGTSRHNCNKCTRKYYSAPMPFQYYPVQELYQQKAPVPFSLNAMVMKGLGHESDPTEWLNYRRNHMQIDLEIRVRRSGNEIYLQSSHQHHTKNQETITMCGSEKTNSIMERNEETCEETHQISKLWIHCNAFSSYDQKVSAITSDKLQPVRVTQTSATRAASDLKVFEPIQVFDFETGAVQANLTLDRIQFSRATLGNYLSYNRLETFTINLELYAQTTHGEFVLIGYALSLPCISRGRAPCHFEKLCADHADPTRRKVATGSLTKKTAKSRTQLESPIVQALTPPQDISFMIPPLYIPSEGFAYFEQPKYVSPSEIFPETQYCDNSESIMLSDTKKETRYYLDYPSPPTGSMDSMDFLALLH
jgi:hypothetical protein